MKANEALEKIYIHVRANKELGTTWHGKKITNGDIEYTRTDAFIEKAVAWLAETLRNSDFYENEIELMIKDFKNTMSNGNTK